MGGGYSEENISGGTSARTGCLSETSEDCSGRRRLHQSSRPTTLDAARFYKQSDWGGGLSEAKTTDMSSQRVGCKRHLNSYQKDIWRAIPKRQLEDKTEVYGSSRKPGFSSSSSSDRLTEEQENEIAENIYDWWISGKSYKRWYADKFLQLKIKFDAK